MTVRIVRLGTERAANEGLRIGTVRRPPRGVPKTEFNEAISLEVYCKDQAEIDYYWEKLSASGDPKAQQCGWLKDKFSLSWQIVPAILPDMVGDSDSEKSDRVMTAMLKMQKLDVEELKRAHAG